MGLPQDLVDGADYPASKVSVFTSGTTALMPAKAKELSKTPMCTGLLWIPCFSHVANLLFLKFLKIDSFAMVLAHAKRITRVFRVGNFRKLFLMYASLY